MKIREREREEIIGTGEGKDGKLVKGNGGEGKEKVQSGEGKDNEEKGEEREETRRGEERRGE